MGQEITKIICEHVEKNRRNIDLALKASLVAAIRDPSVPLSLRNRASAAVTKGEREGQFESPKPTPVVVMPKAYPGPKKKPKPAIKPETPQMPEQTKREVKKLVKALKKGDVVWFEKDGGGYRAAVNHITPKTLTVEVGKRKDIMIYKGSIMAVEVK